MGLTERHWFEDEEPELTEQQLEDVISMQDKAYRHGYQKGYSDGAKEQEAVEPKRKDIAHNDIDWFCGNCGHCVRRLDNYCSRCGRKVKWE